MVRRSYFLIELDPLPREFKPRAPLLCIFTRLTPAYVKGPGIGGTSSMLSTGIEPTLLLVSTRPLGKRMMGRRWGEGALRLTTMMKRRALIDARAPDNAGARTGGSPKTGSPTAG